MNKGILAGIVRATELTRAGRLAEATKLIQASLSRTTNKSAPFTNQADHRSATEDIIEGKYVEVPAATPSGRADSPAFRADSAELQPVREGGHTEQGPRARTVDEPRPATEHDRRQIGDWKDGTYQGVAGQRAYKLYVPSGYNGQPLPLIVMLHGCKQTPDDFAAGTTMNALGEEHGCFVLYPAQSNSANPSRCWNWFRREDQVRDRGEPAILAGMTREIVDRYRLDSRKVYVAGLSAGGAMAAVMGVTYPDLYAAVGIHSGLACGSAHDLPSALAAMKGMPAPSGRPGGSTAASHAIPTIVFHGDRDRTVHPRNGADVIAQSVHSAGAGRDQVFIERGEAPHGHSYTRTIHRDASGRVVLEHWLVHGGGHAWFGGDRAGSYTDPRGPSAAAEMIRFFLQN
jgi:poly(hydroxyalkanoate) depolymerase family esterase